MLNYFRHAGIQATSIITLAGVATFTLIPTAHAAEEVTLKHGIFRQTVTVDSLRDYAKTGNATGNLASLLRVVSGKQRESLTGLLKTRLPYGVVEVDRLLKSPVGQKVLNDMAEATILPGKASEVLALRSAALGAASQDKSLSFVTLIEKYPTPNLTVDLPKLNSVFSSNPALGALLGGQGAPGGAPQAAPPEGQ